MKTQNTQPTIGLPVTYGIGSDSYPYTITAVSPSGKRFEMTSDRSHGNGLYTLNPDGKKKTVYLAADGTWKISRGKGCGYVTLGLRSFHWSPEF